MVKSVFLIILVTGLVFTSANIPQQEIGVAEECIDSDSENKILIKGVVVRGDSDCGVGSGGAILVAVNPKGKKAKEHGQSLNKLERIAPGIKEGDIIQIYGEVARCITDISPLFVTINPSDDFYIKKIERNN